MIISKDGEIKFDGKGDEVSTDVGEIMHYFFENATELEIMLALATFKDGLSMKAKISFLSALAMVMK